MHEVEAKSILSQHNGMNIYRGCSHGCIYCDSRSECYQFSHSFEDIEVKRNAPELLERALRSKRSKCMIGTGSMCDPYMHIEERLCLTRRCLEIIDRFGFGVAVQTKSARVLRDIDLLDSINKKAKAVVQMTLTTYDDRLCRLLEPNVSTTSERFEALMRFRERGIPTVVWICPLLPYINDSIENLEGLLDYCVRAGVKGIIAFGMGLTLRAGSRDYYYAQLDRLFPGLKAKYMRQYGNSYELPSPNSSALMALFKRVCGEHGIMSTEQECFAYLSEFPTQFEQLSMFDM